MTGSPPANPYRFRPPASPIGSSCVEGALCAAQRVVLENDAESGRAIVVFGTGNECRRQARHATLHDKIVFLQPLGEKIDGARLLKTDLGMTRDVIAERQELRIHQLLGARHDFVARRVGASESYDQRRNSQRALERIQLLNDIPRRLALRRRFLGEQRWGEGQDSEKEEEEQGSRQSRVGGRG